MFNLLLILAVLSLFFTCILFLFAFFKKDPQPALVLVRELTERVRRLVKKVSHHPRQINLFISFFFFMYFFEAGFYHFFFIFYFINNSTFRFLNIKYSFSFDFSGTHLTSIYAFIFPKNEIEEKFNK